MASEARMIGYEFLKTATLVSFRIIDEEVLNAPADEAEFGLRLQLKFVADDEDNEEDEDYVAENTAEWGVRIHIRSGCPVVCGGETSESVRARI